MGFGGRGNMRNKRRKWECDGVHEVVVRGFWTQVVVAGGNTKRFWSGRSRGTRRGRYASQEWLEN